MFEKKHRAIKAAIKSTSAGPGMAMQAMKKVLENEDMQKLVTSAMQNLHGPKSALCPTARAGGPFLKPMRSVSSISEGRDNKHVTVTIRMARTKMRLQQDELEANIVQEFRGGPGVSLRKKITSTNFTNP